VIPLSSTTITVKEVPTDATRDGYDVLPAATILASGVRAVISSPGGRERRAGGSQQDSSMHLDCDPCPLTHRSTVTDEKTGTVYTVNWVEARNGMGLDRMEAGLQRVVDRADSRF
jgi:hypothetical protein